MDNWMTASLALAGSVVTAIGTAFTMGRARFQDQRAALQALVDSGVQKHAFTCEFGEKLTEGMRELSAGQKEMLSELREITSVVLRVQGHQENQDTRISTTESEIRLLRMKANGAAR